MKSSIITIAFIFFITLLSCDTNETEYLPDEKDVDLFTDRNSYMNLQDIAFKLCNNSHNNLSFLGCWFSNSPVIEIEKYKNEEWATHHFTICVEYSWHQLNSGQEIIDTIHSNWFDTGKYRLKCQLLENDSIESIVYSNVFAIENNIDINFSTDKTIYDPEEKIAVKFENNTSSGIRVNYCRLYNKERYENGMWDGMGGPPCPMDGSFIYIAPNHILRDTINSTWLENGKYRLVTFSLQMDSVNFFMYSNEFEITDSN